MARPSTLPALLGELRTYLDQMSAQWDQSDRRTPTLPVTGEGKVNVRALAIAFREWAAERGLAVPASVWQYVYADPAWAHEVNAVAAGQGLKPIRSRESGTGANDPVQAHLDRVGREAKAQAEGHALARVRLTHLERELAEQKAENVSLRERLSFMRRTGMVVRIGDETE